MGLEKEVLQKHIPPQNGIFMAEEKDLLVELVGSQLSSVEFVQDYLQLHFNGITLTCYIWPTVFEQEVEYSKHNSEYKNVLCRVISKIITDVIVERKKLMQIFFGSESKIVLALNDDNPDIVAEIAILSDTEHNWEIFD